MTPNFIPTLTEGMTPAEIKTGTVNLVDYLLTLPNLTDDQRGVLARLRAYLDVQVKL